MGVCPKCGYEYEPHVMECPECGVRLVEPDDPEAALHRPLEVDPELARQRLVSVYVGYDEPSLGRVHSALVAEGIRAAMRPFHHPWAPWLTPLTSAPVWSLSHPLGAWGEVLVLEQDVERAKGIIEVLETGRIVADDMPEGEGQP